MQHLWHFKIQNWREAFASVIWLSFKPSLRVCNRSFSRLGPRPRGLPRSEGRELSQPGLPLPSAREEREPEPGARSRQVAPLRRLGWRGGRPLPADQWHCASLWRASPSAGPRGGGPDYPASLAPRGRGGWRAGPDRGLGGLCSPLPPSPCLRQVVTWASLTRSPPCRGPRLPARPRPKFGDEDCMSSRFSFWRVHAPLGRGNLRPCFPIFTSTCCSSAGFGHGPWLPTSAFVPAPPSGGAGSWALGERVPRRPGAGCLERGPLLESRGKQRAGSDCILQALEERSCALPGRKGDLEGTQLPGELAGAMVIRCASAFRGHWASASSSGCGGRASQGRSWSVSRLFRGFPCLLSAARGQAWSSPSSTGLRSGAHIFIGALLSKQAHHFPGVGRTGEREQRPARARKSSQLHLSQKVISAPSELALWLWLRVI